MEENLDLLSILQERLPPFSKLLGIKLLSTTPERVAAEMRFEMSFARRQKLCNGGALMAFADTLGACASDGSRASRIRLTSTPGRAKESVVS